MFPALSAKHLRLPVVAAVLVAAVVSLRGASHQSNVADSLPATRFGVFDNSQYTNVDLEQFGLVRSGIIEETPMQAAAIRAGEFPDKAAFQHAVAALAGVRGPLVLDYEDLYLTGSAGSIAFRARLLAALTRWAREAAPGKVIGVYGLLDHASPRYFATLRHLARGQGAFFPSLYLRDETRRQWRERLIRDIALAHSIDEAKPVYPYLWPQRVQRGSVGSVYLGASEWAFELAQVRRYANGVVIWSKKTTNHGQGWLRAMDLFMRLLRGEAPTP